MLPLVAAASATEHHRFLHLQAGELVRGVWEGPYSASLDVIDPSLRTRNLKSDNYEKDDFVWLAPETGVYQLRSSGLTNDYGSSLQRVVAPPVKEHEPTAAYTELSSPVLQRLQRQLQGGGDSSAFWQWVEQQTTPLVEPYSDTHKRVSFLWRGEHRNVRLFGGPATEPVWMRRLAHGDVWFASFILANDSEFSYQIAPDVPTVEQLGARANRRLVLATAQADPHNPRRFGAGSGATSDSFSYSSVLRLEQAPARLAFEEHKLTGKLSIHRLPSRILNNERDIALYRSASTSTERQLLVLLDMGPYLSRVKAPQLLSYLEKIGCLPATDVVMVANPSAQTRTQELPPNPDFADFIVNEVLPFAAAQGISAPASRRIIAGSSFGGLASTYVAQRYPEEIPNVISLSGSYWWAPADEDPEWTARQLQQHEALPVQFFLSAGEYEGGLPGRPNLLDSNKRLLQVLQQKGYAVHFEHYYGGHDYYSWQRLLANGLLHFHLQAEQCAS